MARNLTSMAWIIVVVVLSGRTHAQQTVADPPNDAATAVAPAGTRGHRSALGVRQQAVRRMMLDMERKFKSLAYTMAETEPERAGRLEEALRESKSLLIEQRMEKIARTLNEVQLDDATQQQQEVVVALKRLIQILTEEEDWPNLEEEIDQLEEWREQIGELLEEEQGHLRESQKSDRKDEALSELDKNIETLENLIEQQKQVIAETKAARTDKDQDMKPAAKRQRDVREETQKLADQIEPEEKSLEEAVKHQSAAEEKLKQEQGEAGQKEEEKALEEMNEALEQLQQQRERMASQPEEPSEKMAEAQDKTQNKTEELGDEMEQAAEPEEQPGQEQIEKAQEAMKEASEELREEDPSTAAEKQAEAVEQLEEALEETEEELAQMYAAMQAEELAMLEAQFREMLDRQQKATAATAELQQNRESEDDLPRVDRIKMANLAREEHQLADQAQQALDVITEDATSVVFPVFVAQLRDDLSSAGQLIEAQRTGDETQQLQGEIEQTLQELIEALEAAQESGQGKTRSGSGGGEKPSLLPSSAELKLLRSAQLRVNRRTTSFDESRPDTELDEQEEKRLQVISLLQKRVADITQRMIEKGRQLSEEPKPESEQGEEQLLIDVQRLMDDSHQRLARSDSGEKTQEQQEQIVKDLQQLIEAAEAREQAASSSGGGSENSENSGGGGGAAGGMDSEATGGPAENDRTRRQYHGGPRTPWGQLRDKDRRPVYNALKAKFPDRYQQVIEEYFQSLQEDDESP